MNIRLLMIWFISLYQKLISPYLGPRCRFYPSCSHYAVGCLNKYSLGIACRKIVGRLFRCQPWHKGGFDHP